MNVTPEAATLLQLARDLWVARSDFRRDRRRNKRYTYGRQWDDLVTVDGCVMTEEQYIQSLGNVPLTNNLIRRLVRSVLGVYRNRGRQPVCYPMSESDRPRAELLTRLLHANAHTNRLTEIYARSMEEFLISGCVVHRKWYGHREGRTGCWTDSVDPDSFFMDASATDCRAWDVHAVGQLHDLAPDELIAAFATDAASEARLRDIYAGCSGESWYMGQWGAGDMEKAFLSPSSPSLCRVIEIWRRENDTHWLCHDTAIGDCRRVECDDYERLVMAENRRRLREGRGLLECRRVSAHRWRYYYLSPNGAVLAEGDSPYRRFGHPYVIKAYPYIDGEVHSFVADIIDQQRYTNRLVTLNDWMMRASAKGVLLFPEDSLGRGMSLDDVADQWSRFNGIIPYRPRPGVPLPQQVSGSVGNLGITELLSVQMKMLEDISGVNAALQGKLDSGSVSGTLFNQQTQNSLTSLLDILESFDAFVLDAACRDADNICRFGASVTEGAGENYFDNFSYDIHLQ